MIINDIIETKTNHFLAIFKDYLITDYIDEFLKDISLLMNQQNYSQNFIFIIKII